MSKLFAYSFIGVVGTFLLSVATITTAQFIPYGKKNTFEFTNEVQITDVKQSRDTFSCYKITGKLTVSSVWNSGVTQLLYFEYDSPKLLLKRNDTHKNNEYNLPKSSYLDSIPKQNFYLVLIDEQIKNFISNDENDIFLQNFKRGIASLFQFEFSDDTKIEEDSSGKCSVIYYAKSSTNYRKFKTGCSNWNLKLHRRQDDSLGVTVKSFQDIDYELSQDGHLAEVLSRETHMVIIDAKPDLGSHIESIFSLRYESSVDVEQREEMFIDMKGYNHINLKADIDGNINKDKGNLKQLIKSLQSDMGDENIGTQTAALNLIKLLPIVRMTETEVLMQILKAHSTQNIQKQLIDILGAAQTIDAYHAITQIFKYGLDEHLEHLERYLQAVAIGTRPKSEIIKHIKEELHEASKNEKLIDTTIQTLAALSGRYAQIVTSKYNHKLVNDIQVFLLSELTSCEKSECKEVYIRALENLRDPHTIPVLLKTALEEQQTIPSVAAMKALRSFNINHFTSENRKDLEKIFYQIKKKFDSSVRTLALDILLDLQPNKGQLTDLLLYLISNDKAFEVKTYLLQKVNVIASKCPRFASLIREILKERPELNNYHIIGQKGLTTVLERTLSSSPSFNESLLSIQEIKGGILRRGVVDMLLHAGHKEMNTFKLSLYTKGLSSFVGGGSDVNEEKTEESVEEEEEELPTAGMEISVQGVSFRPLVFFNGQSELMGHVWSGTASDPTPAYQATTLLQDHEKYIILQNGGTLYINVLGAKSVDLNGKIQFSLWNRNAHTEISKNYGTALQGLMDFRTSFITLENKFTTAEEPKLHLIADIDFYSDIMLCLQLSRPDSSIWHKTLLRLSIEGTNFATENSMNITYKLPGNTLALNRKNNEMCNRIFA